MIQPRQDSRNVCVGSTQTPSHRLLFLNCLDITAHGAAQARVKFELQYFPGAEMDHRMLSLQYRSGASVDECIDQMPENLRRFGFRTGLMLWLFPHLLQRLRQVDAVVIYGVDLQMLVLTVLAARLTRTPVFNEITEHPQVLFAASFYKRAGTIVYERLLLRLFSGMIVISSALECYVRELAPTVPIHVMPPIADASMSPPSGGVRPGLFTYAGSLSEPKDGVISLVRAFDTVHRQCPDARLRIFGHGASIQRAALEAEIATLGLKEVVQLHASIPSDALIAALCESDILVHCRPKSKQATYGFPTKLAEYLSCGRPVVTTDTSDISLYLHDRESAFLVPPDDTAAFAQAMLAALADRAMAECVGARGRQVFDAHFRAGPVVTRLGAWIGSRLHDGRAAR